MEGSVEGGGPEVTDDREETPPPLMEDQIEGHVSALKSLIKSHNQRNKGDPIRLDFGSEDIEFAGPEYKMPANIKLYDGTTDPEDHLSRFASVANSGEWPMPVWCRMFQQTLDRSARGWFEQLPYDIINEWADLREAFAARYSVRWACLKEPHEITKIVMKISSFMDSVKSPELAKRFSNKVPTTVNEIMERLDDFVRSEEAYTRTELPKEEVGETHCKTSLSFNRRDNRLSRNTHPRESRRNEYQSNYRSERDAHENAATSSSSLRSGNTDRGKGTPRKGGSPTSKGDQCDQCKFGKRQEEKGVRDYRDVDEHPDILPRNILGGRFRESFDCRSGGGRILGQKGRNLEAYMDEMVIKSKDEKILLADIGVTFDNLKLNPKKCSFGVKEGKFLGYMSTERSLPFFNTLKNITKENKHEYRWTKEAEQAFLQMKKLIMDLSSLTPPWKKETLYAYLAVSAEVVSPILLTDRKGRYFEAHPVKVIMDQPIKNILNNTETSRKLAKYDVELGAYNITFIPRNVVKGQVLVDFVSEAPKGEKEELYFQMPEVPLDKDDTESWTLFTDGASSLKGSRAGLVLIGPSGIEYTYALCFTFLCTNNEAEYEALLARLIIAQHMNISNIEVKVDSKLVASQINENYEASKDSMIKYLAKAREYATVLKSFLIENIPRNMNQKADVLSKLASVAFNHLTKEVLVEVLNERSKESQEVHTVVEEEGYNWMTPIIRYLEEGIWPKDKNEARGLRAMIGQYVMESGVLFKKWYLVAMLGPLQSKYVLREIHMRSYGTHVSLRAVVRKAVWQGVETAKNSHDVHYGPVAFLSVGHGHPRTAATGKGRFQVRNHGNRLLYQMDRSQATDEHDSGSSPSKQSGRKGQQEFDGRFQNPPRKRKSQMGGRIAKCFVGTSYLNQTKKRRDAISLTYGSEAVIPPEIGIPTYRTLMIREGYNEEEMCLNLDLLQERR
nr:hypothetical protein [Tanacetum cinerariifolium]